MTRVLVTAIGTMNCTTIIRELKKADEDFYILGADIYPKRFIANSNGVDEFYQFPKVLEDREYYASFVLNFCKEHGVQVLYCVIDEEVQVLAQHREEFLHAGVTLCVADTSTIVTCHDKILFDEWMKNNFPQYHIPSYTSSSAGDISFPVFIKPREGRASIGCRMIRNAAELYGVEDLWHDYLVQQYIECGNIISVDVVRNRKTGQIGIIQKKEHLRNANGCGIAVEIVDIEEISSACKSIAGKLDTDGVVNYEFFLTEDGPKLIEINPRLPAGIEYSCMAGMNVVLNALWIARGGHCEFSPVRIGSFYAKRYETYETT